MALKHGGRGNPVGVVGPVGWVCSGAGLAGWPASVLAQGLVFRGLGAQLGLQTLGLQLLQPGEPLIHPSTSELSRGVSPRGTGAGPPNGRSPGLKPSDHPAGRQGTQGRQGQLE